MPRIELNIDELTAEKNDLDAFLAQPTAYSDPDFSKKNKRLIELIFASLAVITGTLTLGWIIVVILNVRNRLRDEASTRHTP